MISQFARFLVLLITLVSCPVHAELPWQFDQHTRYMALGDSLAAGYGAITATQGYVYLLYQGGAFDKVPNTLFSNAGVPGATSKHMLDHQVPQAIEAFRPTVITITVGGNDILSILDGANPIQVLSEFQNNLAQSLQALRIYLPGARIYISNWYSIPEIPGSDQIVSAFNQVIAGVAAVYAVPVADVYSAFQGRNGLLLVERHGADPYQVHPTNVGYRVMEEAFKAVIN